MTGIAKQAQELLRRFQENNEKLAAKEETIKAQAGQLAARDQELQDLLKEIALVQVAALES